MNAHDIVNRLLEYGRIDRGEDEYGRTCWNYNVNPPKHFWVSPEGEVIRVDAHVEWAQRHVLPGVKTGILLKMQERGWQRATEDHGNFSINVDKLNDAQRAAVEAFVKNEHLKLQHLMIA